MPPTRWLDALSAEAPLQAQGSINQRPIGPSPTYLVAELWSINLYDMPGRVELPDLGRRHRLHQGTAAIMAPGTRRRFVTRRPGTQWVVHFQPGGTPPQTPGSGGILLIDGRSRRRELIMLADALAANGDDARRCAVAWHLLWSLAELVTSDETPATGQHHVDRALRFMRRHLAEPLRVTDIVAVTGCSQTHLGRLFRAQLGETIVGTLRRERLRRARMLLQQTDLPVAAVGAEVGIPDPHLFNKTVRRQFGCPPSALRDAG